MALRLALLTISDAGMRGGRVDASGDAMASWAARQNYSVAARALVADEVSSIVTQLIEWCDQEIADVVLTTGGTGLSPRDVTPEATRVVLEREAPGIAEWLRASAAPKFPRAVLSRGVAGMRGSTLIVNLPGSESGVRDGLAALEFVLQHAVAIIRDEATSHSTGSQA
jgi:molybdenum cofactor synthesis domain-containing protein